MTDKYTREQKIERLQELCPDVHSHYGNQWLDLALELGSRRLMVEFAVSMRATGYVEIAQATWDVHTGLAFTKLYKALK